MSTFRTPSGKATALGSRTAWLRLLVKTVELVMALASNAYPIGIYIALLP
jgi:hypothetical protein